MKPPAGPAAAGQRQFPPRKTRSGGAEYGPDDLASRAGPGVPPLVAERADDLQSPAGLAELTGLALDGTPQGATAYIEADARDTDLVEPGLVHLLQWRATVDPDLVVVVLAGVGRKR